jgi:hypothetical protein
VSSAEADELVHKSADLSTLEPELTSLLERIIDEYTQAAGARKLTEEERRRTDLPRLTEETLHLAPADEWDLFNPVPLAWNIKQAVREELEVILGQHVSYWTSETPRRRAGSARPRPTLARYTTPMH